MHFVSGYVYLGKSEATNALPVGDTLPYFLSSKSVIVTEKFQKKLSTYGREEIRMLVGNHGIWD